MNRLRAGGIAALTLCLACFGDAALASRPVPKTIQGCVIKGTFISSNGYRVRVRDTTGAPVDLASYEGMEIRYFGHLLPGDIYYVRKAPAVLRPCPRVPPYTRKSD